MSESGTNTRPTAADRMAATERAEGDLMELMHDVAGLIEGGGDLVDRWPRQAVAVEMLLDITTTKYAKALAGAQAALADAVGAARQLRDLAADLADREKEQPVEPATPKGKGDAAGIVLLLSSLHPLYPCQIEDFKAVLVEMLRGPVAATTVPDLGPNASVAVRLLMKLGQVVSMPSEVFGHCYTLTDAGRELARVAGLTQSSAAPTTTSGSAA